MITLNYRGFRINAFTYINTTEPYWHIYRDGRMYLTDTKTKEGSKLMSEKHAINDAKDNIDIILRLDHYKYWGTKECKT